MSVNNSSITAITIDTTKRANYGTCFFRAIARTTADPQVLSEVEMKVNSLTGLLLLAALLISPNGTIANQSDSRIDDKDIKVVRFENLAYPHPVQTTHIEGIVVVRVKLDTHGKVVSVNAISGNPILSKICVENAMKWVFAPNRENTVVLVYEFRIEGICGDSDTSQMIFYPPNFALIEGRGITVQPKQ